MRTARSRTSAENLFDLFMAPFSQELEPPPNPGRFTIALTRRKFVAGVAPRRTGRTGDPQLAAHLVPASGTSCCWAK
ncbi:hypothetical protein E2553_19375 [Paraburkholderia dipogonis]|uniref:Uncharacterized protein n=1 Tax=Paraburkholderia dipogonis TaxID=1211383 RepID=A0A4Y8NB87_9BURK|nr:hypothetical protein E2553_19375 [Paraburkholderia dipogonis]